MKAWIIRTWGIVLEAFEKWSVDNAARLAASVAFYSILSLAPLCVLSVAVASVLFGEEAARGGLLTQIRGLVGNAGAEVVEATLINSRRPAEGVLASIIGGITLLFGASGVFGELQAAMNVIWAVRVKAGRGILNLIRDKFLSFGMVLSVGFLLLVSLVVSAGLSAIGSYTDNLLPGLPWLMQTTNVVLSFILVAWLFALVFRYLPDVRMPWKDVWFGAGLTSFLFAVGKYLIGVYLAKAAVGSPYGAAGSMVVLVAWVYYSALIVFFGAEFTQVHARRAGSRVTPTARAEWVPNA